MRRKVEGSPAELVDRDDSSEVRHGFSVLVGIRNRGKRVRAAFILRNGNDVGPGGVCCVRLSFGQLAASVRHYRCVQLKGSPL